MNRIYHEEVYISESERCIDDEVNNHDDEFLYGCFALKECALINVPKEHFQSIAGLSNRKLHKFVKSYNSVSRLPTSKDNENLIE